MKLLWTIFAVLCSSGRFEVFAGSAIWMDSLIRYIKNDVKTNRVTAITDSERSSTVNPVVDELFFRIGVSCATFQIDVGAPTELYKDIVSRAVADTSTMFFVLVYSSHEPLIRSSEKMIDTVRKIAAYKPRPRILLVLHSRVIIDDREEILYHAWSKQLLDFTIVEIVDVPKPTKELAGADDGPIIHQLNPFKSEYTRTKWTRSTEWFPNKVKDMQGQRLKIGVSHVPPYTIMAGGTGTENIIAKGKNIELIHIIGNRLNFSIDYVNLDSLMKNCNETYTICLDNILRTGKVDMLGFLLPQASHSSDRRTLRTSTIRLQELCPVVPIVYEAKVSFRPDFFIAYALSFAIVVVVWIASRKLRFQSPSWRVFGLVQVLFGISATHQPRKLTERVLFACLLFVSALYSANIYTAITGISLETKVEKKFNTFEDLDNSGLVPMITPELYDKTFGPDTPLLAGIKKKVVIGRTPRCILYLAKHKNVTCLMIKNEAERLIRFCREAYALTQAKIVGPCLWSDVLSFPLAEGSPYRTQINNVIRDLDVSGIITRHYQDRVTAQKDKNKDRHTDAEENVKTLCYQLLTILIVGYTLATIVFIAEIIIH